MEKTCGTCKYSRKNNESSVSCHRYPPTITYAEGPTVTVYFPLLSMDNWCGEWGLKRKMEERPL